MIEGSTHKGRIYQRKFDYDEARRRYAQGESIGALAKEYGVSWARVQQVVVPERGMRAQERAQVFRWRCPDCGAETTHKGSRCRECSSRLRRTTVRDDELLCASCGQWLPDDVFPKNASQPHRRGRHQSCRSCNTIARRETRQRHPETRERENRKRMERYYAAKGQ